MSKENKVIVVSYDQNLNRLGVIDVFRSLIWTRKYYEWVETIKGILDDETAGKLLLYIQELQERADVMEKIAATNEVIQNMATSDDELIVTDDGERICARKIFATL